MLVVGAGPAGLAAALAAAESGARVILCDEQAELGGALLHDVTRPSTASRPGTGSPRRSPSWAGAANVTLLPRTTAFGYYAHNFVGLAERVTDHLRAPDADLPRERLWQVRAQRGRAGHRRASSARSSSPATTGPASCWPTPRAYLNRYGVAPGRRAVIATVRRLGLYGAADLKAAGVEVALVDVRPESECGEDMDALRAVGCAVLAGHTVLGTRGDKRVAGLLVAPTDAGPSAAPRLLDCDCVGVSGGWTPSVHLFSQSRGKLAFDDELEAFVPGASVQAERSAGACSGTYQLAACLRGWLGRRRCRGGRHGRARSFAASADARWASARRASCRGCEGSRRGRAFVDFQNDVTAKDIGLAVREGFRSIEHVKRYTTTGMATDQGKTSNMTALGIVAEALDKPVAAVGLTTFRLPYTPVTFGALAGPSRGRPVRSRPQHADPRLGRGARRGLRGCRAVEARPLFPARGRGHARGRRARMPGRARGRRHLRCLDARQDRGGRPGRGRVPGPHLHQLLGKLAPGRCRYGLMLSEDGFVIDDGVVGRLAPDRFHVTTTTGGAARVLQHMEDYLQTEFPSSRSG